MIALPIDSGRWTTLPTGDSPPTPPSGAAMSDGDLDLCRVSDDAWFQNTHAIDYAGWHMFQFLVPVPIVSLTFLRWGWEGHTSGAPPGYQHIYLGYWRLTGAYPQWVPYLSWEGEVGDNDDHYFTLDRETDFDEVVNPSGIVWAFAKGGWVWGASYPFYMYTDYAALFYDSGAAPNKVISETVNPFGQRFRAWDDPAPNAISFERQDIPSGAWSAKTNPFPAGSSQPALECLPNGWLHLALITSAGAISHYLSRDDGETWQAP